MKFALDQLNPNADSKKAAKHKKKEIARRLGLPPGSIETNSYEDVISLEVVTNDNLDVGGLHDVGGLDDIKVALHQKVIAPLREPALFRSSLLRQAKGVLLFGPPGTGKTMLAKALAAESGACFVNVRASTLQSKWFGETNKLVTAVFTLGESFFFSSFFFVPVGVWFHLLSLVLSLFLSSLFLLSFSFPLAFEGLNKLFSFVSNDKEGEEEENFNPPHTLFAPLSSFPFSKKKKKKKKPPSSSPRSSSSTRSTPSSARGATRSTRPSRR